MRRCPLLLVPLLAGLLAAGVADAAPGEPGGRTLSFVLGTFTHASNDDVARDCPHGLNANSLEVYLDSLAPAERKRLDNRDGYIEVQRTVFGRKPNACTHPTDFAGAAFRRSLKTVEGPVAPGLDLDGGDTTDHPAAGTCQHTNFTGPNGEPGVDNQWWRVMGCIKHYQHGANIQTYAHSIIRGGEISILIEVTGVDDARNDEAVGVAIYSSSDPVPLDAAGDVTSGGSLETHPDTRFHARTTGRIRDGVLTSDPVDLRLQNKALILDTEWYVRGGRLRLELQPDGRVKGLLAGYADVETFYEYVRQSTPGASRLGGYTCPGLYDKLRELADGYPEASGRCTAISVAYQVAGVPAFVIHPKAGVQTARTP
jgi:hypothetical protein